MKNQTMFDTFAEKKKSGRQPKKIDAKIERADWDKISELAKFAGCPAKHITTTLIAYAVDNALECYDRMMNNDPHFREWVNDRNQS